MIQLPRLLDKQMQEVARLQPVSLSLDLNMAPLSTATMTLPEGQPEMQTGAYVELFTPYGSAGIFRVQQANQQFGGVMTLNLEHGIVTLADGIIPGTLEEEKTTSARAALAEIIGYQDVWRLGTVEVPEDTMLSWSYDYSNLLESFLSILDKLPAYMATFDQTTTPWTINILAVSDMPASECRLSRNISTLTVETDHSELCTRLYVPGLQAPLEADTIGKWGVVSRGLTGDEGLTADELTAYGTRYLEEHKNPALTVSIDALDLHKATGEQMDAFRLGYVCRVCLPDYGQTINQRIVTLSWPDLIADAENVRLTLASHAETAADTLAGLIVDTTVQRRLIYKNGQELDRLVVRTIANEEQITIITPRLDILSLDIEVLSDKIALHANDILTLSAGAAENKAAIVLANGRIDAQANEIALHANDILTLSSGVDDNAAAIVLANGRIDANAQSISLHAQDILTLQTGVGENAAAIVLANGRINANANAIALKADQASLELIDGRIEAVSNEILLKADKIELQGYVTATQLETNYAKIADLNSVQAQITNLTGGLVTASVLRSSLFTGNQANFTFLTSDAFNLGNELVQKRSISMGGVTSAGRALAIGELDLDHSHEVTVSSDGKLKMGKATEEGSTFDLADTQFYKDSVSASYADGYDVGFDRAENAYKPTTVGRTGYSIAERTVIVKVGNAYQDLLTDKVIDASEIYDAGYSAGWAAAKAAIVHDGYNINGPSAVVGESERLFQITAGGSLNNIQNTAANYFSVNGYAYAYVNGTMVNSHLLTKANGINVGQ